VLRKAIGNQLMAHLQTTEDLEKRRAKEYGHQIVLSVDEKAGYENLTRSIMHYEGRAKEARSILRMIDDLELRVHADKCEHCNHHEMHGDGIAREVIPTPHGDITLEPITPQDMEKMKSSLLETLSSSSSCHKEDV
jgi:hypothetical protein